MASTGAGQPQFRYTQPPSKVLHLRNLPWECGEEELVELCKPFGRIVNTKCCVGANRNQAFVEFTALWEKAHVFSAFGRVHKIATFEKTAGFQALVQFTDADTASAAKSALDGRSIPRYLLAEHVGPCHLRISFSAHTDLNVKFQSHRSRDYTNPYLPLAPSAIDGGQVIVGPDGKKQEPESNVLLASIENMQYAVTVDVLHTIFGAFGTVQKIAMFEKNAGLQALVQYTDVSTAVAAKEALEGHCIYEGGYCKLHLSYSRHTDLNVKANNDRSRDFTNPNPSLLQIQPALHGQMPSVVPAPVNYLGSQSGAAGPSYTSPQGMGNTAGPLASDVYGMSPAGSTAYQSDPSGQFHPLAPNSHIQPLGQHQFSYMPPRPPQHNGSLTYPM